MSASLFYFADFNVKVDVKIVVLCSYIASKLVESDALFEVQSGSGDDHDRSLHFPSFCDQSVLHVVLYGDHLPDQASVKSVPESSKFVEIAFKIPRFMCPESCLTLL